MKQGDVYSNGVYKCVIVLPEVCEPLVQKTYVAYKTLKANSTTLFVEETHVFEDIYSFEYNMYDKIDSNPPVYVGEK